ncbi:alkane 1-monooxygenase [Massilia sp. W12]|uniref:alkane 1-monooxygenase n=1 Tax=Massilia sp. W12 TaxID=3126507 RepID=UPI0030CB37D9
MHAAAQPYRDQKRFLWFLSLLIPGISFSGPNLYQLTQSYAVFWLPVVLSYIIFPLLDLWIGADRSNPPEEIVPQIEADPYYRYITFALAPLLWLGYIGGIWYFTQHQLPLHVQIAGALTCGGLGGYAINLAHELGHKKSRFERGLARLVLMMTGYGHFYIEHNHGHHRDVATPADSASSRMGENIYRFMLREMPGGLLRAWALEKKRLAQLNLPVWHGQNKILQAAAGTLLIYSLLLLWLGWSALPFMLGAAFWSNFQLTTANYIEHYGLLRQKDANGRYEICSPRHSWNSNQLLSNWAMLHLQRHADHHAHPTRRYQSLRHFDDAPQLPNGYFGMFVLAYLPPLWFKVMDARLLETVGFDARRINFDPKRKQALIQRYQLDGAGK